MKIAPFKIIIILIIVSFVIFLIYFRWFRFRVQHEGKTTVNVGYKPSIITTPYLIGIEKGFFADEGLNINLVRYKGSGMVIGALNSNTVDVSSGSVSTNRFNAFSKGLKIHIIADLAQGLPSLMIRKDLWDTGTIRDLSDLRDKNIVVSRPGSGSYYVLATLLDNTGIDIEKDVNLKYISQKDLLAAFQSKSIDAAITYEPYAAYIKKEELAVPFEDIGKYFPEGGYQIAVLFSSERFMKEKPEVLRAFLRGYVRSLKFLQKVNDKNSKERAEIFDIIQKYLDFDRDILNKINWYHVDPDGIPNTKSIEEMRNFFYSEGLLEKKLNLDEFIDLTFLPAYNK